MTRLFIDTTTSAGWKYGKDMPDSTQPYVCRLSWLLESDDGATLRDASQLIRLPEGVKSDAATQYATGIFQHFLDGPQARDLFDVMDGFAYALGEADLVVAHAWTWQKQALERSFRLCGMPARASWPTAFDLVFKAVKAAKIPAGSESSARWKAPSFNECCDKFVPNGYLQVVVNGKYMPTMEPVRDGMARVKIVKIIYQNVVQAGLT